MCKVKCKNSKLNILWIRKDYRTVQKSHAKFSKFWASISELYADNVDVIDFTSVTIIRNYI